MTERVINKGRPSCVDVLLVLLAGVPDLYLGGARIPDDVIMIE